MPAARALGRPCQGVTDELQSREGSQLGRLTASQIHLFTQLFHDLFLRFVEINDIYIYIDKIRTLDL